MNMKEKLEESQKQLALHKNEINSITMSYENISHELETFKGKAKRHTAKLVAELENKIKLEEFTELALKKQRYGYITATLDPREQKEWIEGAEQIRLTKEKESLERQIEMMEMQKKSMRGRKKKDEDETQETKERLKSGLHITYKRLDEINKELDNVKLEKFDIFYKERKITEAASCYFSKAKPDQGLDAWPLLHDRYKILSLLGKGGFAEVYKAYDLEKFRYVAVKVHQMNAKWNFVVRNNFIKHTDRENKAFQSLSHPNIVKYYDTIEIDELSYGTVLEYCEGFDLDYMLKKNGQLPEKDSKAIIKQMLGAVKYLNEQTPRIIHYDLKPQNILFTKGMIVKITDFGLCKMHETEESKIELTTPGGGTYWYLPPECFEQSKEKAVISGKVDIWSIGVMFYQMLYGIRPFGNGMSQERIKSEKVILRIKSINFPDKPSISQDTKDFIKQCLTYDQNERIDIFAAYSLFSKIS